MAVVLTIGAGLLARSLHHLVTIDHGFAADHLLAVDLYLRGGVTTDGRALFRDLIDNAEAIPGVRVGHAGRRTWRDALQHAACVWICCAAATLAALRVLRADPAATLRTD